MEDSIELTLAESLGSLRALARALARDDVEAEDLVQQAALEALRKSGDQPRSVGWLRGVVRNTWRMSRRANVRRERRERAATSPDAVEPNERVHLYGTLCRLVSELPKPLRDVVVLRFVEEMTSVEIGKTLGIAASTARVRLKRALVQLRAGLEPEQRRVLVPFVALGKGLFVKASTKLSIAAIVAILMALTVGGLWHQSNRVSTGASPKQALGVAQSSDATATPRAGLTRGPRRQRRPIAALAEPERIDWEVQVGVPTAVISGRVEWNGVAVSNASVSIRSLRAAADSSSTRVTKSDREGRFRFDDVAPADQFLVATYPGAVGASTRMQLAAPSARDDAKAVVLRLKDCAKRLRGTVANSRQSRITLVEQHRFFGPTVAVDGAGNFTACIAEGESSVLLRLERADGSVRTTRVDLSEDLDEVELGESGGARILGKATKAKTGAAARGVQVNLWGRDGAPSLATTTDDLGKFVFESVEPGRYAANAWGPDLLSIESYEVVVEPAANEISADIVLTRTTRISGTIRKGETPAMGVRVQAGDSFASFTQEDGSFTLRGVAVGHTEIVVSGHTVVSPEALEVPASGLEDIDIQVEPIAAP